MREALVVIYGCLAQPDFSSMTPLAQAKDIVTCLQNEGYSLISRADLADYIESYARSCETKDGPLPAFDALADQVREGKELTHATAH
jgi:hypothetical protein